MDNAQISTKEFHSIDRGDGQRSPVVESEVIDGVTGEIKKELTQRSARFFAYNQETYPSKVLLARKNPVANSIFEFFVSEMDNTNAICVSMNTLEQVFELKRNAISKHIKYLVDKSFISVFKIGNMNVYAVNAYVVWTQGDANLHRAKFTATMYLNFDEQTSKIKREFSKKINVKPS